MPTGSSVGAKMRRATRSAKTVSSAPTSAAGTMRDARRTHEAAGDRRRHEGDEGDRSGGGGGERGQRDADQHQAQPGAPDPDAERGSGVVAELEQAQAATEHERHRHQHGERDADRANVLPPAAVERAGQPHGGALDLVDLGAGDQVVGDGGDGEADADPDQDQAIALHAALPRAQVRPAPRSAGRRAGRRPRPGRCHRRRRRS